MIINTQLDDQALGAAIVTLQRASVVTSLAAPPTKTTATTLTAAELLGGLIVASPASTVNYQLPLTADLEAAMLALTGTLANNDAFKFTICNTATAANIATLTTNSTWALVGSMAVAGAASGSFLVRRTGVAQFTIYQS